MNNPPTPVLWRSLLTAEIHWVNLSGSPPITHMPIWGVLCVHSLGSSPTRMPRKPQKTGKLHFQALKQVCLPSSHLSPVNFSVVQLQLPLYLLCVQSVHYCRLDNVFLTSEVEKDFSIFLITLFRPADCFGVLPHEASFTSLLRGGLTLF